MHRRQRATFASSQGFSALNLSKYAAEHAPLTGATGFCEVKMALPGARFTMRLVLNVLTCPPDCTFSSLVSCPKVCTQVCARTQAAVRVRSGTYPWYLGRARSAPARRTGASPSLPSLWRQSPVTLRASPFPSPFVFPRSPCALVSAANRGTHTIRAPASARDWSARRGASLLCRRE